LRKRIAVPLPVSNSFLGYPCEQEHGVIFLGLEHEDRLLRMFDLAIWYLIVSADVESM
jgi:hypothetical protein